MHSCSAHGLRALETQAVDVGDTAATPKAGVQSLVPTSAARK